MVTEIPKSNLIRVCLLPISWLYALIIIIRNWLFDCQLLRSQSSSVPVISVGNITVGGTGKTPMVIAIAEMLLQKGHKVGILSRGYKRQTKEQVIVSDGKQILVPVTQAGDEPYLMAQKVPTAVIIADSNRVRAARTAIQKFGCTVLIADDAFQHRYLARQLDLVLWHNPLAPEKEHVLPAGRLREPFRGIRRAHWVIFTRTDHLSERKRQFFLKKNPALHFATAPIRISYLWQPAAQQKHSPTIIFHQRILSFCGLGNHEQFFALVEQLQSSHQVMVKFPDHYRYQGKDVEELLDKAAEHDCTYLLTTEKDALNLPVVALQLQQLFVVAINFELMPDLAAAICAVSGKV